MLEQLDDGEINDLRLVVAQLVPLRSDDPRSGDEYNIPGAVAYGVAEESRRWSLLFESYVCYAIHNESFAVNHEAGRISGRVFRTLEESVFLTYVRA